MEPRPSLCPRCGGVEHEWVDDSHTRCTECGLGATVSTITFAGTSPPDPEAERRLAELQAWTKWAMAEAPFGLFGLDDRWLGPRSTAGHGSQDDTITQVTLAHGDVRAETGPLIKVETHRSPQFPVEVARVLQASSLVHHLWHLTGELRDDVRLAAFPGEDRTGDPTEPWDLVDLPVDGAPVPFRVLTAADCWVALGTVDDRVVSIEARSWPLRLSGLETIRDLGIYR